MRFASIPGLAASVGLGTVLLAAAPGLGQVKMPGDFAMEKGEASPSPVLFSHAKHKVKVDKCTTCHLKTFKMKRGQSGKITLEALQEGKFCGSCHDGKTRIAGAVVFPIDACDKCHP